MHGRQIWFPIGRAGANIQAARKLVEMVFEQEGKGPNFKPYYITIYYNISFLVYC